jgi:sensor histidine kinase YesM
MSEELKVIKAYLDIEQLRLGPRLEVRLEIENEALHVQIPALSIQPLVENAVKHGVARQIGNGRVELRVRRAGDLVQVEIWDTGPGFAASGQESTSSGIGLENVRQRLRICYGPDTELTIRSAQGETMVGLAVPAPQSVAGAVR